MFFTAATKDFAVNKNNKPELYIFLFGSMYSLNRVRNLASRKLLFWQKNKLLRNTAAATGGLQFKRFWKAFVPNDEINWKNFKDPLLFNLNGLKSEKW